MDKIRITKIDGQEFVPYKDYIIAQREIEGLRRQIKWLINNYKKVWEGLIQTYKDLEDYDKEDD